MTPEGKIKSKVKEVLAKHNIIAAKDAGNKVLEARAQGWYFMPSQNGMGVKGIPDFIGHIGGTFFAIETKAPGKEPTGFQMMQIGLLDASGAAGGVFVIDSEEEVKEFDNWLLRF